MVGGWPAGRRAAGAMVGGWPARRRAAGAMVGGWVELPSGLRVRGRRIADRPDDPVDFLLALADGPTPPWTVRRIDWPDFRLPRDRADALAALADGLRRAREGQRVEVACLGGRGRTGTALAAMAVLDGMDPAAAVPWVRRVYHPKAVETPGQARWVRTVRR